MVKTLGPRRTVKDVKRETVAAILGVACGWVTKIFAPEFVADMPLSGAFNFLLIAGIPLAISFFFIEGARIAKSNYPPKQDS